MASMTDYLEENLLNHLLPLQASLSKPAAIYLSLHTSSPTDTGSLSGEVSGGSYAREDISSVMSAASATTGRSTNTSVITYPTATADWGVVTHGGINDALTAGNMLFWVAGSQSRDMETGETFRLEIGQLALTFR